MNKGSQNFMRKTMSSLLGLFQNEVFSERYTQNGKLLQIIDPRVKLLVTLSFLLFCGMTRHMTLLFFCAAVAGMYIHLSGLSFKSYVKRVWLTIPVLLMVVSLPATTNWLVHGTSIVPIWGKLAITAEGLHSVFRMALRVGTSLSFAYLLVMTTRWHHLTKSLEILGVPSLMINLLNLTYRYLFVLSRIALEMMEARFLRTVGRLSSGEGRQFMAGRMAHLFVKSSAISEDIYGAMKSRGYTGIPVTLTQFKIKAADKFWAASNVVIVLILSLGEWLLS